jgi:hypothetical protein
LNEHFEQALFCGVFFFFPAPFFFLKKFGAKDGMQSSTGGAPFAFPSLSPSMTTVLGATEFLFEKCMKKKKINRNQRATFHSRRKKKTHSAEQANKKERKKKKKKKKVFFFFVQEPQAPQAPQAPQDSEKTLQEQAQTCVSYPRVHLGHCRTPA